MSAATSALAIVSDNASTPSATIEAAFDRCSSALYRYLAVRTGGDTHLADDLMQQLWLKAVASGDHLPVDELEFWLRGVAKNLIRTHWRTQARRLTLIPLPQPELAAELADRLVNEEWPPLLLERQEVRDQLLLALTELPGEQQELIIGHYFHDRSHAGLAAEMNVSERAVEGRLYRARQALRKKLQHLDDAEPSSARD